MVWGFCFGFGCVFYIKDEEDFYFGCFLLFWEVYGVLIFLFYLIDKFFIAIVEAAVLIGVWKNNYIFYEFDLFFYVQVVQELSFLTLFGINLIY